MLRNKIDNVPMKRIALTIRTLAFAALIEAQPSYASEGPWCAYETVGPGSISSRCDLPNYEACRAWIRATPGTWCTQNPRYVPVGQLQRGNAQRGRNR